MNRPLLGLLVGAGLGILDGLSALVSSPEVSGEIGGIVVGSAGKGLMAGIIVGLIARKLSSSRWSTFIGVVVAAVITFPVAHMNATHYGRPDYYWKIMLPGALVGAIVGYVVMRYGKAPQQRVTT
ncbi:MAG: hypothetical protein Q8L48_13405 [Archangium sp.]|nr:hypothetical protein [Archangium sp.]